MAIFSVSVSKVQRSRGQSATAAAAYQLRCIIDDPTTGEHHDYRRAGGIVGSGATVPLGAEEWADPAALAVLEEQSEKRLNAVCARRAIVALPCELNDSQRLKLAAAISQAVTDEWGVGCAWAVHPPETTTGSDSRNEHMHMQWTTRMLSPAGLGKKTREWDDLKTGPKQVERFREFVETTTNGHLASASLEVRIDRRSHAERKVAGELDGDILPTRHEGPAVTEARRRGKCLDIADSNDRRREHNAAVIRICEAIEEVRRLKADYIAVQIEGHPTIGGKTSLNRRTAYACAVRERIWHQVYGDNMPPGLIDFVRYIDAGRDKASNPVRAVRLFLRGGGEVLDKGSEVVGKTCNGDDVEIAAMLEIARVRGWSTLTLTGTEAFKEKATDAAHASGFSVAGVEYSASKEQAQTVSRSERCRSAFVATLPTQSAHINLPPPLPEDWCEMAVARADELRERLVSKPEVVPCIDDEEPRRRSGRRWRLPLELPTNDEQK